MRHSSELDGVLAGLIEGVLVVDWQNRIISINTAAAYLLDVRPADVVAKPYDQTLDDGPLRRFVDNAVAADHTIQQDASLTAPGILGPTGSPTQRFLRLQGVTLHDAADERIGTLVLIHDVTRLRRLEVVRRDFVSNVSHEIKTPVTAIKAAVETLLESAPDDPAEMPRFLRIISRQADRLHAIVEDLLTLARIEQDADHERTVLEHEPVEPVLHAAVEACQIQADAKRIGIELHCPDELVLPMNRLLLEQAMVNLLDNAIKYSPADSRVRVYAERRDGEVMLAVADDGPGIEAQHLPRLFERFYRTDKARSRELGGTGLGLSIVKHVAQAHGGHVTVESQPGQGSTFRIHLPAD